MITGLMLKRVNAPSYAVQLIAVVLLFGGASVMLWRVSNTGYAETAVTFLAFFTWQVATTLATRFSKPQQEFVSKETDATAILLRRALGETGKLKKEGSFAQVMGFCAGFAVLYIIFRGLMLTMFTTIFSDLWMAGAFGALMGAVLIAPWLLSDLKEDVDKKLQGSKQ